MEISERSFVNRVAPVGLIAKGIIYVLLGVIALMAALNMGRQKDEASNKGVFNLVEDWPAGIYILGALAIGLICYTAWRFIQAWKTGKWPKKIRYMFSGLGYASLAFTAFKIMTGSRDSNGDSNQALAAKILSQSYGQWIMIAVALFFAGIGVYQVYYGLKEKYKKHIGKLDLPGSRILFTSAKIGYIARGIVWLIVAYLFANAGLMADSSEAGNTGKAFKFIESNTAGSYLLGMLALGVIMYGIYNFIRARYDRFDS